MRCDASHRTSAPRTRNGLTVMTLDQALTIAVVGFSAIAGAAWLRSATATIKVPKEKGNVVDFRLTSGAEPEDNQLVVNGVDVWRTSALQSRWNTRAAAAACVAALLQAWQSSLHW